MTSLLSYVVPRQVVSWVWSGLLVLLSGSLLPVPEALVSSGTLMLHEQAMLSGPLVISTFSSTPLCLSSGAAFTQHKTFAGELKCGSNMGLYPVVFLSKAELSNSWDPQGASLSLEVQSSYKANPVQEITFCLYLGWEISTHII